MSRTSASTTSLIIKEPADAIVEITSTAICGSDLHLYRPLAPFVKPGDILGHEPSAGSWRWAMTCGRSPSVTSPELAPGAPAGGGAAPTPLPPLGRITVVVASRDRRAELARSLPRHEASVILVDNGSTDGTVASVRETQPDVMVVSLPVNRGAPARNIGVRLAVSPYVAFADDDSWWEVGSLARAVEVLDAHPRVAVVAARVQVGTAQVDDPICAAMAAAPLGRAVDLPGPSVLGFLACGVVVRRSAFLEVGGFDDVVFFGGEEERVALDLASAGWGLAYVPELVVHHHPSAARDSRGRALLEERNRLLVTVMRRPWGVVAREVVRALRSGPAGRAGVRAAVRRSPSALRARRRVPARVEAARRALDRPD